MVSTVHFQCVCTYLVCFEIFSGFTLQARIENMLKATRDEVRRVLKDANPEDLQKLSALVIALRIVVSAFAVICNHLTFVAADGTFNFPGNMWKNIELVKEYLSDLLVVRIIRKEISDIFAERFEELALLDS